MRVIGYRGFEGDSTITINHVLLEILAVIQQVPPTFHGGRRGGHDSVFFGAHRGSCRVCHPGFLITMLYSHLFLGSHNVSLHSQTSGHL